MAKKILAVLAGTIVMVVLDPLIARFITPGLTFGISASVFIGSVTASLIVNKHGWFVGLIVGIINCCITLGLFYWHSPQVYLQEKGISMADVVVRPMVLSLVFGIIGGAFGQGLKKMAIMKQSNI